MSQEPARTPPRVSVVLPVHNGADALPDVEAALGAQAFGDLEVVVVDDGSTDATADAVRAWAARDPRVVPVLLGANGGVAAARNAALARATGELVWFVDCDDEWSPDFLRVMVDLVDATGADLAVCGAVKTYARGAGGGQWLDGLHEATAVGREDFVRLLLEGRVHGYLWNKLVRREALGPSPFPLLSSQSDFAGLVGATGAIATAAFTPRVLYTHVGRPGSITNSRPDLRNLLACRELVHDLATRPGSWFPHDADLLLHFDHWFAWLAVVNTATRLRATDEESRRCVAQARAGISLRGIALTARSQPRKAASLLAVAWAYPLFGWLYAVKAQVRRSTGTTARRGAGTMARRTGREEDAHG